MNIQEIDRQLKTRWLGKKIHYRETVDSTNSWALSAGQHPPQRGEVFLADFQTKGHGRQKRVWEAPPGKNILLSFIDSPPADKTKTHQLTLVCGVALLKALQELFPNLDFKLKWPNDIYLDGKKLAGLLAESRSYFKTLSPKAKGRVAEVGGPQNLGNANFGGDRGRAPPCDRMGFEMTSGSEIIAMGVGLNVNSLASDLSPDVRGQAISLYDVLQQDISREKIIAVFLAGYEMARSNFDKDGLGPIIAVWNENTFLLDRQVRVQEENNSFEGRAQGLDENGFLLVKTAQGIKTVVAGDVLLC